MKNYNLHSVTENIFYSPQNCSLICGQICTLLIKKIDTMSTVFLCLAVIVLWIIVYISIYNILVARKNQVEYANGTVNVMFKNRYDLIPTILPDAQYEPEKYHSLQVYHESLLFMIDVDRYNGANYVKGKFVKNKLELSSFVLPKDLSIYQSQNPTLSVLFPFSRCKDTNLK
jgi:hypothetical protein